MNLSREIKKQAVRDFFGKGNRSVETWSAMENLIRRNRPKLTEDQTEAVWHIKENLKDKTYRKNLEEYVLKQVKDYSDAELTQG